MTTSDSSSYATDYGQHTPMLQITPGRDCRLWPYLKAPDCTRALYRCKSKALQGMPVDYDYTLAGETKCSSIKNPKSVGVFDKANSTVNVPSMVGAVYEGYVTPENKGCSSPYPYSSKFCDPSLAYKSKGSTPWASEGYVTPENKGCSSPYPYSSQFCDPSIAYQKTFFGTPALKEGYYNTDYSINYSSSVDTPFPSGYATLFPKCTNSSTEEGGCRCSQNLIP